jgi:hypothetical protein
MTTKPKRADEMARLLTKCTGENAGIVIECDSEDVEVGK